MNAFKPIFRLYRLLSQTGKREYRQILRNSFAVIFLEILGLGILYISALIILDKGFFVNRPFFNKIMSQSGLDPETFMLACLGVLVFVFIIKNLTYFILQKRIIQKAYCISGAFSDQRIHSVLDAPDSLNPSQETAEASTLTTQFSNALLIPSVLVFTEILFLVFSFILVTFYKPRLSVFLLASLAPPMLFVLAFYRVRLKKIGLSIKRELPSFYRALNTIIYGKNEMKLYQTSDYFKKQLLLSRSSLYKAYENIQLFSSTIPHKLLETVAIGSILALAFYAYINKDFQALAFMVALFGSVAFRMLPSINRVLTSINTVQANQHLLDYIPTPPRQEITPVEFKEAIEFQDVSFAYFQDHPIISNLSMTIKAGEYIGVVGKNGSGKSTLSKLLLGLIQPSSGQVSAVKENRKFPILTPLSGCAYVSQHPYLMEASISENIAFGRSVDNERFMSILTQLNLGEWVNELELGLDTQIGERGTKISGGQAQRIGLARALNTAPNLLVLDEALHALDEASLKVILEVLSEMNKKGMTIVQIAHDAKELVHAKRIINMDDHKNIV